MNDKQKNGLITYLECMKASYQPMLNVPQVAALVKDMDGWLAALTAEVVATGRAHLIIQADSITRVDPDKLYITPEDVTDMIKKHGVRDSTLFPDPAAFTTADGTQGMQRGVTSPGISGRTADSFRRQDPRDLKSLRQSILDATEKEKKCIRRRYHNDTSKSQSTYRTD